MKTLKFFTDTETTGLLGEVEQVLTFSVVLEKPSSVVSAEYERKIKLKKNVLPNPRALLVNNLNPFIESFKKEAMTEYEAYEHLKKIAEDGLSEGFRILVVAYNAEYDRNMYDYMFKRFGDKIIKHYPLWWDPLPTARRLIDEGVIETEEVRTAYKTYRTAKLEAVYKALGNDASFKAHSALDDTKMLQMAAHGIYQLATGKKLEDMGTNPESYKALDNVFMILDDDKVGLQKRLMKVLYNDIDKKTLVVLDSEVALNQNSTEKPVKTMSYYEIIDELPLDQKDSNRLDNYYQSYQVGITEQVNEFLNKKEKKPVKEADFNLVVELAMKFKDSTAKKTLFKSLTEEERELVPLAEDYLQGRFETGFIRDVKGQDYLTKIEELKLSSLTLKLDPKGLYILMNQDQEIVSTEKRTVIQEKVAEALGLKKDDAEFKELNKQIPYVKEFKNAKHPEGLLKEYEDIKGEVFNGANKDHKDLLTDLLSYFKEQAPEVFGSVSLPSFKLDLSSFLKKK